MFGVGISELLLFLVVASLGAGSLTVLYFVLRAAVRDGSRRW